MTEDDLFDLEHEARSLLRDRGMDAGMITEVTPGRWVLKGLIGSQGVMAEIEGVPDAAIIAQAADQMAAALNDGTRIR